MAGEVGIGERIEVTREDGSTWWGVVDGKDIADHPTAIPVEAFRDEWTLERYVGSERAGRLKRYLGEHSAFLAGLEGTLDINNTDTMAEVA